MKKALFSVILMAIMMSCSTTQKINLRKKILVFSATKGARHKSIAQGKLALINIGLKNNWLVDTTELSTDFTPDKLKNYEVVVFLNTTGNVFTEDQKAAFVQYIQNGGSFVGIHSASDTEKEWPWYNNLVGGIFANHPKPQIATYHVVSKNHPSVAFMPDTVSRMEEIYNLKSFKKDLVKVLITVDEKSYTGGNMGTSHPIAWYHNFDGGKAFYTAWGHSPEAYNETIFLNHITGALKWAIDN